MILCAAAVLAAMAWAASPQLRWTVDDVLAGTISSTRRRNLPTSIGKRLEFWQKSLRFFAEAPLIGHGTGSTRGLFEQAATGPDRRSPRQVDRQSAQPDAERRDPVGRDRRRRALRDVAVASAAVPRRRAWPTGSDCWWWCRIFSPRCSILTCSISTRAGCMCWAWASPAAWC